MSTVPMPDPLAWITDESLRNLKTGRTNSKGAAPVNANRSRIAKTPIITTTQAEAYKDACVREAQQWISVDDRLPDAGLLVLVYSPPQPGDWPDSIRVDFDCIDPDSDGPIWLNHSEHYEHFCMIAKGGADCPMIGPSEKAPYTHWMRPPPPPQQ